MWSSRANDRQHQLTVAAFNNRTAIRLYGDTYVIVALLAERRLRARDNIELITKCTAVELENRFLFIWRKRRIDYFRGAIVNGIRYADQNLAFVQPAIVINGILPIITDCLIDVAEDHASLSKTRGPPIRTSV